MEGRPNKDTEAKATAGVLPKSELNLEIGRNIYEANARGNKAKSDSKTNGDGPATNGVSSTDELTKAPINKVNCHQCGVDCTRVYYHSSQADQGSKAKYDLCPSCFADNRFPANHSASQYIRLENPTYTSILDRDAPWSDAEILRLLEGLERYDDDWGEIAEHVGTRTREECVLQFLQLDIEDKYLESEPPLNPPTGMDLLGTGGGQLPFNQADNPVMSVVGFLASLADPASTAAAANKSAEALKQNLRNKLEAGDGAQTNGKGKEKEGGEDSMELDIRQDVITTTTTTTRSTKTTTSTLASVPLATIGARAGGLASHEEREMTRLVSAAVNVTLQKMELKLKYFNEMEAILQAERRELERARQQLFLDRLSFKRRVREVQEGLAAAMAQGGDAGLRAAQEAMLDGDRMTFAPTLPPGAVQPLSAGGHQQIKSYDA
jgi:SWI/SNF related-matrix-associated actin-dependent regulator of chromatin subfamily C